ncbi:putative ABC transport system permease protein [Streptosporangium subroseum]|uniref:Putative ABC transport system permease protein n=1 Tax=Streptosporangium subroseum TaxID=106412 RepID=A0A239LUP5_9ACTN|nr:ABC transporter permease [Streptosporangium subroseum]SNT33682.1 putative ABC transport system permease protein [Streptosporangium subroseum]
MLIWLRGLLARRTGRLIAAAAGIAVAVALLASLGVFLSAAKSTMTARSVQRVPVDWQIEVQPGADPTAVAQALQHAPGIEAVRPVGFAAVTGFESRQGGQVLTTGAGQVLGLPADYTGVFPGELRPLTGFPQGALLAQQTAANLHAGPGDTITLHRAGRPDATVRVDGIVDLPEADSLFQKVGAPPGAQLQAPPDNVLLLPADQLEKLYGAPPRRQFHARLSHRLPSDPAAAYEQVTGAARNLEVRLAGGGLVGDNLGAALDAARSDALYAQILFLFLGLPGALLAALLTAAITGAGAVRRRADQALLRTRGASTRALVRLALAESIMVGVTGVLAGLGLAAIIGLLAFGSAGFGATAATVAGGGVLAAIAGLLIAGATTLLPAVRDARTVTVASARRTIGAARPPWWMRYGLDGWLLLGSAAVFLVTSQSGYQLVLVPEGVPQISVDYWAFAGPALLWAGSGLLIWRLTYLTLGSRGLIRRLSRPLASGLAGTVAATLSRQRRLVTRTVAIAALAVVFATSTATFDATYRRQALVDAQLTNGADVTVTESPGAQIPPSQEHQIAAVQGVAAVEPLQHRFAYVGADLQDLYGIRPATLPHTTRLEDAYFVGGTARTLIDRLARRPDAILVSQETVHDFQLHIGDLLRLRLQDGRTKQFHDVDFHYAGIAAEFPTAPRDSFLVANAAYVAAQTGSDTIGAFLVTTDGTAAHTVADRLRSALGPRPQITDLDTTRRVIGSSLTAVDLGGLTTIELTFALGLAVAATALLLIMGFTERRRTFALATVLGARSRQLGAFVWTEVLLVGAGTALFGGLGGWALSQMLVSVLTGVFDPPPSALSVPWPYLGGVAAVGVLGLASAGAAAVRAAPRPPLTVLRDL